jgi:soluble lytic murein transglycosylase
VPAIPQILSTESYAAPQLPTADPRIASQAASTLAAGMQQVGNDFANVAVQAFHQKAATDAMDIDGKTAMALVDLNQKYEHDPDPSTAPQRWQADVAALRQSTMDGISSPLTARYVEGMLARRIPAGYAQVSNTAFRQQHLLDLGTYDGAMSTQSQLLASAPNEAQELLSVQALKANTAGIIASNGLPPQQGATRLSAALRTAVMIRGAADPVGASALLDRWRGDMTADDVALASTHLRAPMERQQGVDAATAAIHATGLQFSGSPADDDATYARMLTAESHNQQTNPDGTPVTSPAGAVGIGQVMPATAQETALAHGIAWDPQKFATDPQYNAQLGRAYFGDMLARYDGNRTMAVAAYNAGPGRVDDWKTTIGDPRTGAISDADFASRIPIDETRAYVGKVMGNAGPPDLQAKITRVRALTTDLPLPVQLHAENLVVEDQRRQDAGLAVQRGALSSQIANLEAAYGQGVTSADVPEDQIRKLYPPDRADAIVQSLNVTRAAGDAYRAVQFASPDEEQQLRAQLAVPGSVKANAAGRIGRDVAAPALPDDGTQPAETPDVAKLRGQVVQKLDQLLAAKHQALAADPASYAAASPDVQAAAKAIDPKDPATLASYLAANQAVQRRLGVAPSEVRTLSGPQISRVVQQLHSTDPSKADMGAAMDGLAQQYGSYWPAAFSDLVRVGKLSPDWQVLGAMDTPAQTAGRQDMQRALVLRDSVGAEKFQQTIAPTVLRDIDKGLDDTIAPFRQTAAWNDVQGGIDPIGNVRSAVRTLAVFRARQGQSAGDALTNAYQDVIGAKYDTDGTLRTPKGMMDDVQAAGRALVQGLQPGDLAPQAGKALLTQPERDAVNLRAVQSQGFWVPNRDDTGVVLVQPLRQGGIRPVLKADNTPLEMKFNALPAARATPPLPPGNLAGIP